MQDFGTFLVFISVYDRKKIDEISCNIDFTHLEKIYQDDIDLEHYHANMVRVLYNLNSKPYNNYVQYLIDKLNNITDLLISINPEYSLVAMKEGKKFKMSFHGSEGYDFILNLLSTLEEEEEAELVLKIINDNKDVIKESILNNISNSDRSNEKYDFLVYLYNKSPELLKEIFNDKEKVDIHIKKLYSLLRGKVIEKRIACLYLMFIKEFTLGNEEKINQIRNKFPSVKNFEIKSK